VTSKRKRTAESRDADRKTLRRSSRRRGASAACLCFALGLVFLAFEVSDLWQAVDDGDALRAVGSAFVAAVPCAIILIGSAVYIRRELRRSPLVIRGRTVSKIKTPEMVEPYGDIELAVRLVQGPRWIINVNRACRLNNDGVSIGDLQGEQEVRLTRKLYRGLKEGESVMLLCTPGGKGFRQLPLWPSWAPDASAQPTSQ
jgi:hypothetical protein